MMREKTKSELVQLKRICRLMGRVVGIPQGRITHGDLLVMTGSFCCIQTLTLESSIMAIECRGKPTCLLTKWAYMTRTWR